MVTIIIRVVCSIGIVFAIRSAVEHCDAVHPRFGALVRAILDILLVVGIYTWTEKHWGWW
jgi:hypothetical protein